MSQVTYRQEMRRCGRIACRRCESGPSHGPYWYAYSRDEYGRLRCRYVGKQRPPEAEATDAPPSLHITLLGGYHIARDGEALAPAQWQRSAARMLLAVLLLNPDGMSRERVADLLWPDKDTVSGVTAVRVALTTLRHTLEPRCSSGAESYRLPRGERLLRLHIFPGDSIDIHELLRDAQPEHLPLTRLRTLVALYAGRLLPEYDHLPWITHHRDLLKQRWQGISLTLARRLADQALYTEALPFVQAVLDDEPAQEAAATLMMSVLDHLGRQDDALRLYAQLERALQDELGVAPRARTQRQVARMRARRQTIAVTDLAHDDMYDLVTDKIARLHTAPLTDSSAVAMGRLLGEQATALLAMGDYNQAFASIERGQRILRNFPNPNEECRIGLVEARAWSQVGRFKLFYESAQRAALLATEPGLVAHGHSILAEAAGTLGLLPEARKLISHAAQEFDLLGLPNDALECRWIESFTVWRMGEFETAVDLHRCVVSEAATRQNTIAQARALCGLGAGLWSLGQLDEAQACLISATSIGRERQEPYLALVAIYHLANLWVDRAYLATNRTDRAAARQEAQARFTAAYEMARAMGKKYMVMFTAIDLAVALMQWGIDDAARHWMDIAEQAMLSCTESDAAHGWMALSTAEFNLSVHNAEAALVHIQHAIPLLERGSPAGLAQAHRVAARAHDLSGNRALALEQRAASLRAAAAHGQVTEALRTETACRT